MAFSPKVRDVRPTCMLVSNFAFESTTVESGPATAEADDIGAIYTPTATAESGSGNLLTAESFSAVSE